MLTNKILEDRQSKVSKEIRTLVNLEFDKINNNHFKFKRI